MVQSARWERPLRSIDIYIYRHRCQLTLRLAGLPATGRCRRGRGFCVPVAAGVEKLLEPVALQRNAASPSALMTLVLSSIWATEIERSFQSFWIVD
jgi:hypothetical protein